MFIQSITSHHNIATATEWKNGEGERDRRVENIIKYFKLLSETSSSHPLAFHRLTHQSINESS